MLRGLDLKNVVSRLHGNVPIITMRGAWELPAKRVKGFTRQCYMCRKFETVNGTWRLMLKFDRDTVSHVLCPHCAVAEMIRVKKEALEFRFDTGLKKSNYTVDCIERSYTMGIRSF